MFEKLRIGEKFKTAKKFTPVHPDPAIGKSHGISLYLYSKHSPEYRNAVNAASRRAAEKKSHFTLEEGVENAADLIVMCCAGWEGVTDGKEEKEQPYDPVKLKKILSDEDFRWLRVQADRFIQDDTNFF